MDGHYRILSATMPALTPIISESDMLRQVARMEATLRIVRPLCGSVNRDLRKLALSTLWDETVSLFIVFQSN